MTPTDKKRPGCLVNGARILLVTLAAIFLLALAGHKKILLDLEELTFFDSLSVSVLLSMNKLLKKTGGSLRVCGINYIIDDLFTALNIYQIIPCFKTAAEAQADWTVSP